MVKGLDVFRNYFAAYTEQYVLIGGAACDISFTESDVNFRATKDLDIVLVIEAQTREFGQRFWEFIEEGKYRNRTRSNGKPQFYRFDKPQEPGFPAMIELFAKSSWILDENAILTPVHIDDTVSSLSAILLDDSYYEILLNGRNIIDGLSVLKPVYLIPFKVKAWLDLSRKFEQGLHVDSRDIKKHKNDILRMLAEFILEPCELPEVVKEDMKEFTERMQVVDAELKNLGITGIHQDDLKQILVGTYNLK